MSALTCRAACAINRSVSDHQWVELVTDADATNHYVFANINQTTFAVTGRLNYTMTPNLSLQLYGQPFVSGGDYRGFKQLANGRAALYASRLRALRLRQQTIPTSTTSRFGRRTCCGGNTSLDRRSSSSGSRRATTSQEYGDVRFSRDFGRIFDTPAQNVLLVKLAYWINY